MINNLDLSDDESYLGLINELIEAIKDLNDNYAGLIISVIINEFVEADELSFDDINAGLLFHKLKDKKATVNTINGDSTGWRMNDGKITAKTIKRNHMGREMKGGLIKADKIN